MKLPILAPILALIILVAGIAAGYTWEHRARVAEVSQIREEAAEESAKRMAAALRATDQAIGARDKRIFALDEINRRLRNEIKTKTIGRDCLSVDAVGLLHQSPAFGLPAAPAVVDESTASVATDTDVAEWIAEAAGLYERCRATVDALRAWDYETFGD